MYCEQKCRSKGGELYLSRLQVRGCSPRTVRATRIHNSRSSLLPPRVQALNKRLCANRSVLLLLLLFLLEITIKKNK